MKKFLKRLLIFVLIIVIIIAFSSSYSALNIDNLATVVALGIDTSDTNTLRLSFQFTLPSSVSDSGSSEQSPSIIYTVDASSISSGINLMNTYIGKELNLSHCKVIAFSEELAARGISNEIYTLINDAQIRPSTNLVITKTTAKLYIENSKPTLENLLPKYYEVFVSSSQSTGFTSNATIGHFFNSMTCNACDSYAILGGISSENSESSTDINSQKDSSGKSNESPLADHSNSENTGLAVFKDDKLVGELNSIETLAFLLTDNKVNGFLVSVPDPEESNSYIDIYLTPITKTSIDVKIVNGTPYISLKYNLSGRIYSMKSNSKYLNPETIDKISASCSSYLESTLSNYLYKISKDLRSDINGFGKLAKSNFLTNNDFENYNWSEKFKDSFFDVSVNSSVRSGFLLTET